VLIHNHPSGNINPSAEDTLVTKKIVACCKLFDILVLDHIIVGNKQFLSFADSCLPE
jgi:DNA repair protein RadC